MEGFHFSNLFLSILMNENLLGVLGDLAFR